jgi:hypothetical protein
MKKSEFKQLIKESVREVLVTEGFLSTIVAEVVKGIGSNIVTERVAPKQAPEEKQNFQEIRTKEKKKHLQETKKRMLDAIGKDAYGGVNVFEGTSPIKKGSSGNGVSTPNSALDDVDPSDPGVDISGLLGATSAWKQMIK